MIQKHSDKIAALESIIIIFEASNAMLEIHTANLEQAKKIVSSTSKQQVIVRLAIWRH